MSKVKNFIKRHKTAVICSCVTVIGMVGIRIVYKSMNSLDYPLEFDNLTVADFGKVGEKVIEACPGVKPDTVVKSWCMKVPKN